MVQNRFARKFLSAAVLVTGALAAMAIPQASSASVGVYLQYGSPAPYFEPYRQVRHDYIWVPGYWDWYGHRQVWIEGTWLRQRQVHHYPSHRRGERHDGWNQSRDRHDGWNQSRGRWDRDGDGIPDYRDSRPDNPRRW